MSYTVPATPPAAPLPAEDQGALVIRNAALSAARFTSSCASGQDEPGPMRLRRRSASSAGLRPVSVPVLAAGRDVVHGTGDAAGRPPPRRGSGRSRYPECGALRCALHFIVRIGPG